MGAPQSGRTPLYAAALWGKEAVAQVLLLAGADKEVTDSVRAGMNREGEGAVVVQPFPGFLTGIGKSQELGVRWRNVLKKRIL